MQNGRIWSPSSSGRKPNQKTGEEELPFEALAALPDEMLCDAFVEWVAASKLGQITQVKVGMVVNAVRLKFGAELIDPIPKKNAAQAKAPATPVPSLPGSVGGVQNPRAEGAFQSPFVPWGNPTRSGR